jgi:hypothetical protein
MDDEQDDEAHTPGAKPKARSRWTLERWSIVIGIPASIVSVLAFAVPYLAGEGLKPDIRVDRFWYGSGSASIAIINSGKVLTKNLRAFAYGKNGQTLMEQKIDAIGPDAQLIIKSTQVYAYGQVDGQVGNDIIFCIEYPSTGWFSTAFRKSRDLDESGSDIARPMNVIDEGEGWFAHCSP